jgi:hypothetical protein
MNNTDVEQILDRCQHDLDQVKTISDSLGLGNTVVPYLTRYAIIRSCGAIEVSYKTIIADYCSKRAKKQVKFYLTNKVRENSNNPSYDNICRMLSDFDKGWNTKFKEKIKAHINNPSIMTSVQSLVDARNEFAHGGSPGSSINNVIDYFLACRELINILDSIII